MQKSENSTLCLDIGNTHIVGGVFFYDQLQFSFRYEVDRGGTSDQLGIFLRSVLRENGVDPKTIQNIAICSVVPQMDYSISSACRKYFSVDPFEIRPGVKTGLKIKYYNPKEVGADIIAEAVAALTKYPGKDLIIVDFGTATTFCAVNSAKEFLGGAIMPGMRLGMEALQSNTAKLPTVPIIKPEQIVGRTTIESIQTGLYYSQLAAVKGIIALIVAENFPGEQPIVIGTGGFAHLFAEENVFSEISPNIVLEGLLVLLQMNQMCD